MGLDRREGWLEMMRLVVLTSAGGAPGRSHEEVAGAALGAGCRALQLRDKEMGDREFAAHAERLKGMCDETGALFFVNDRVDVALLVAADGVHLGVDDIGVRGARTILGPDAIIGYSPEGLDDGSSAASAGADYLGVGPVNVTGSKPDAGAPLGLEGLKEFCGASPLPVIAVGGMDRKNSAAALAAGAAGVAAMSAVGRADDIEEAVLSMLRAVGARQAK